MNTVPEKRRRLSPRRVHLWLEQRLGVNAIWSALFLRKIPYGVNWLYTLGFVNVTLFLIQAVTGTILAMYYSPSPDHAYGSVQYIMTELPFGWLIRGVHHWGASVMVVTVAFHALAVFIIAAYKYPREATWLGGVALLLVTLGFGFTGYLLPWDEKAYWATTVGTNMAGTVPLIGGALVRILRGGAELGALTLTRFFAAHVLLFPASIAALIGIHLFMVIRQGVSVPPRLWDRSAQKRLVSWKKPETSPVGHGREDDYHRRYETFKANGRPFFPDVVFEDAVMAVLVTLLVLGLGMFVAAPLEAQADPTNTSYVPRPEWYFMFLFQMLKYFPGSLEWVGSIVLPSLIVLVLVLLPFIDRRPWRSPFSRPFAMGAGAVVVVGIVGLTALAFQSTPSSTAGTEGASANLTSTQLAGERLVEAQGCTGCHMINGKGGSVGPPLNGVGSRRDASSIQSYIENPKSQNPAAKMPAFSPPLSQQQVEEIAQYLLTLK